VTLRCNKGATPFVAVNPGQHAVTGQRYMLNANAVDTLAYAIKKPTISGSAFTTCPAFGAGTDWTDTGTGRLDASAGFSASGGSRTVKLCVQSTITDVLATGLFSDQVQVSVALQ
jgi:hypothetical protein